MENVYYTGCKGHKRLADRCCMYCIGQELNSDKKLMFAHMEEQKIQIMLV